MRFQPGTLIAAAFTGILAASPVLADHEPADISAAAPSEAPELAAATGSEQVIGTDVILVAGADPDLEDDAESEEEPEEAATKVKETKDEKHRLTFVPFEEFETSESIGERGFPYDGPISVNLYGGTNFTGIGDFVEGVSGLSVSGTRTITVPERDFEDVYHVPLTIGFDINHRLNRTGEAFISFHYTHADGEEFTAMTISPAAGGVTTLTGEFSDYQEFGVDIGYRHFLRPMGGFEPWVAGRFGFKAIDNIELDLQPAPAALATALGGGLTPASFDDIGFFDSTLTYNVGLDVGFQYRIRHNISLGFETGLYYSGDLDSDEDPFSFDGLFGGGSGSVAGANDDGSRLYIPIHVKVRIGL